MDRVVAFQRALEYNGGMMLCQYVTGTDRKSASGERGTVIKNASQMTKCEVETDNKINEIPICEHHAIYSKPMWEWNEEDWKLCEEIDGFNYN
jgi:hypothetical protein